MSNHESYSERDDMHFSGELSDDDYLGDYSGESEICDP
jgi:hypothetical protein